MVSKNLVSPGCVVIVVRNRLIRTAAVAGLMTVFASCGPTGPKLYPVTGSVLFEGKSAEGAMIAFHPVSPGPDARLPGASVGKDGSFSLRTYPYGEGAPEGDYYVGITWLEDGPNGQAKNRLPEAYAHANKSGLKATVKPGPNALEPFKLVKKP